MYDIDRPGNTGRRPTAAKLLESKGWQSADADAWTWMKHC